MSDIFEARCDWCHKRLVGFKRKPMVFEVIIQRESAWTPEMANGPTQYDYREVSHVCEECYARLRRMITNRGHVRKPGIRHDAMLAV